MPDAVHVQASSVWVVWAVRPDGRDTRRGFEPLRNWIKQPQVDAQRVRGVSTAKQMQIKELEGLIESGHGPAVPAELALGRQQVKRGSLTQALMGRFTYQHGSSPVPCSEIDADNSQLPTAGHLASWSGSVRVTGPRPRVH